MMHDVRQYVFLVGGLGRRLGVHTRSCAKPMLEVDGVPFIVGLIHNAARFGFTQFLLLAGYKGESVAEYFSTHGHLLPQGCEVRVLVEPYPLGTGGALLHAKKYLSPHFVLANGDSFFDCNLLRLLAPPLKEGMTGRMFLRYIECNTRYGSLRVRGNVVTAMEPPPPTPSAGLINAGIYYLRRESLDAFAVGVLSLEQDILPQLIAQERVECAEAQGYFIDIGIPKDLDRGRREHVFTRSRPAIFFDRDGVLNCDTGYTHRPQDLRWLEDAQEAVRWCNERGWWVFVTTNQAGVARGYYGIDDVNLFHAAMQRQLRTIGAHVDEFVFCPHHPDGIIPEYAKVCPCRKPAPGMLQRLFERWNIDKEKSLLIGDRASDIGAAENWGITSVLYSGGSLLTLVKAWAEDGAAT